MKSIDLFCASPASTAICSSTVDQHDALVRRHRIKKPPIDRHMGSLFDTTTRRCLSQLPIDPSKPFSNHRKSTSSANNNYNQLCREKLLRRKSSADVDDLRGISSRYLLSDRNKPYLDFTFDSKRRDLPVSRQPIKEKKSSDEYKRVTSDGLMKGLKSLSTNKSHESPVYRTSDVRGCDVDDAIMIKDQEKSLMSLSDHLNVGRSNYSSGPAPHSNHQVVELRVSIHCKGCEGKLRKHISRMQGVTTFSIDLTTKKVTVIGNVTPLEVLTSISKVKNAQLWSTPTSSASFSSNYSTPRIIR